MVATDGTRAGQQRSTQRHERDVGLGTVSLGRLLKLAGEQLQRDQQEQQAAGALQGGHLDPEVGQHCLAEHREGQDHPQRHHRGLPG